MYVHLHICITMNEKNKKGYTGGFGVRKGKLCNQIIITKNKYIILEGSK